jgi:glycosyltransferase involved in cell wall biosynthesis
MADITLLSTADWDQPLWTNKQHVACELAALGQRVLYVESLGLRSLRAVRPGAKADGRRVWRRLRRALGRPRQVRPNLWVWSPLVVPGAAGGLALQLNRWLLRWGLTRAQRSIGWRRDCLWTYSPMTLAVLPNLDYGQVAYHCVDAIQAQPEMPAAAISHWEQLLCRRADQVFVTSPALLRSLSPLNRRTRYYPNVADGAHFAKAMDPGLPIAVDLVEIPEPRLGFVGAVSGYKLDLPLLVDLARRRPEWSLVLVGPVGEGDPSTDVSVFQGLANVHLLGQRPYTSLPAYLKGFQVGLLPLGFNAYTQAMFPMKFFEYLAAGLPVVASAIDALQPYGDLAQLVPATPEAFEQAIATALAGGGPNREQRLAGAAAHTYRRRTEAMLADLAAAP